MEPTQATVALVKPIAELMAPFPVENRIALLCALLAQEICMLPPAQRRAELQNVIDELPLILLLTEETMRDCLARNARDAG